MGKGGGGGGGGLEMKGVAKDSDMITEDGTKGQMTTVRKGRRLCGGSIAVVPRKDTSHNCDNGVKGEGGVGKGQ